jgi:hypothetical protein
MRETAYLVRTIFLLACVEDKVVPDMLYKSSSESDHCYFLDNDAPGLQDQIISMGVPSDSRTFRRRWQSLPWSAGLALLASEFFSTVNSISAFLKNHLSLNPHEHAMVTTNIFRAIQHLRYSSGSNIFALRSLAAFILWWELTPRLIGLTFCSVWFLLLVTLCRLHK